MKIIKNNTRYILALAVIVLVFLINKNFFISKKADLDCASGDCKAGIQEINLSNENPILYFNDVFKSQTGTYYRMTFRYSSNENSEISVRVSTATDEQQEIKSILFEKAPLEKYQEILFRAEGSFTDLIFEKKSKKDGAGIFIANVQITKLNIENEKEFSNLRLSTFGNTDLLVPDQKQTEDLSYNFEQLKESGIVLGQVFKPDSDYFTGVSLDLEAYAQSTNDRQKFILELRNADFDGEVAEIQKDPLAQLQFSLKDLGKYRQENGKFHFPLFYPLSREKYYFIGINNKKADATSSYYLTMKGSKDSLKYPNGKMVSKKGGLTYPVMGSLYFMTYGAKFQELNGKKILSNTIIEDIGKGRGMFSYLTKGFVSDLVDLDFRTPDIAFDDGKKIIYGSTLEKDSNYTYKFDTIYKFSKINLQAKQASPEWNRVKISFSLDQKNWTELPYSDENGLQNFDWNFEPGLPKDSIYFRVSPLDPQGDKEKYGLSGLKIQAELSIE
jgi:hypothetical protein